MVTRYVVTEWAPAFERGRTDAQPVRSRHPEQPAPWHPSLWDARYRIRAIEHYLTQAACDTAVLSRLMTDPALPGRFRLYWIERTPHYWEDTRALRATAYRAAEAVAAGARADEPLVRAAREVRERLDRRDWESPTIERKPPAALGSRE